MVNANRTDVQDHVNEIFERAAAAIGADAVAELSEYGLYVIDAAALARYKLEQRKSNDRIRETAAATMKAAGVMTTRVEIEICDGLPRIIVTFPAGDEKAFAREVGRVMASLWQPDDPPEGMRVVTPESAAAAPWGDTTEVDTHAVGPGVASEEDMIDRVEASAKRVPRA